VDNVLEDCMDCVIGLWIMCCRTVWIVLEDCVFCVGLLWIMCWRTVDCVLENCRDCVAGPGNIPAAAVRPRREEPAGQHILPHR